MCASHLLRIVDNRAAKRNNKPRSNYLARYGGMDHSIADEPTLKWLGELSEDYTLLLHRGIGGGMYTRKAYFQVPAPIAARIQRTQVPFPSHAHAIGRQR
jgi:hypothetical protein